MSVPAWARRCAAGLAAVVVCVCGESLLQAQLAITEVMANASTIDPSTQRPDFWELTNFGVEPIDLSGYWFTDNSKPLQPLPASGVLIAPGESIVFVRKNVWYETTEMEFRKWWDLPADFPRVLEFPTPGFSSSGDSLRLYDPGKSLVDRVDFGASPCGVTLTYDPNFGALTRLSEVGVCVAFEAATGHDIGSPGAQCGTVPLKILAHPADLVVIPGMDAQFAVEAAGLPRPKYQWFFNDALLQGANGPVLTVSNAQPEHAGTYFVAVSNGIETLLSSSAVLTVRTNPCPPLFASPPTDCSVLAGHSTWFRSVVAGYPPPALQWLSNSVALPNETNRTLNLPGCSLEMSGSVYCLLASNVLGTTRACATLTVILKSDLRITEVMARSPTNTVQHRDWFELNNSHTNAVNLLGFRYGLTTNLDDAHRIETPIVIQPGESLIFADALTRDEFIDWWGADNLPRGLQVITWRGFGISPSDGEILYLWDPYTRDPNEVVAECFTGQFIDGVSQFYEDTATCWLGCDSVVGERGAFMAVNGGEIGSPGYDAAPPLEIFSVAADGTELVIKGRSIVGKPYALKFKNDLRETDWLQLETRTATNAAVIFRDQPTNRTRFYRLQELP